MTLPERDETVEGLFPELSPGNYSITSPMTEQYNCIAWAAGDTKRPWWPQEPFYWPPGVLRAETRRAFQDAFQSLGYYQVATSDASEEGLEKIALFEQNGRPCHAARQLPDGRWSSKLGDLFDIAHRLHDLAGEHYGTVVLILQRPRRSGVPDPGHGG